MKKYSELMVDLNESKGNLDFLPKTIFDNLVRRYGHGSFGKDSLVKSFAPNKLDRVNVEINKYIKDNAHLVSLDGKVDEYFDPKIHLVVMKGNKFMALFSRSLSQRNWNTETEYVSKYSDGTTLSYASTDRATVRDLINLAKNDPEINFKIIGIDPVRMHKRLERFSLQQIQDKNFQDGNYFEGPQAKILGSKVRKVLQGRLDKNVKMVDSAIDKASTDIKDLWHKGEAYKAASIASKLAEFIRNQHYQIYASLDIKDDQYYSISKIKEILNSTKRTKTNEELELDNELEKYFEEVFVQEQ